MNPDGINLTVQAATAEIVESFNKLSTDGIKLRTFPSMGNELVLWNEFSNAFKKGLLYLPSKKKISTIFTKSGRSTQAIRHGISWRLEKLCPGVQLGQASWYR
jgi:hypothetical protein